MKLDLRYTATDCFETFPFPLQTGSLAQSAADVAEQLHAHRRQVMKAGEQGLTRTYHRFHSPDERDAGIKKLRELHVEMDEAVKLAYGWDDLKLDHGFHETKQGIRYTISEAARVEVLDRLLALNHERYAEEVKAGLHGEGGNGKKGRKAAPKKPAAGEPAKKRGKRGSTDQMSLLGDDDD